jgi:predicted nucleotidyltransferase
MADRGTNSFAAWRTITPEHNALVDAMLQSPCHIIATMRAKQEYVLETNDKGKQQPKKVGMAPVQREGMEYEFTVMLDVDMHHVASASKDRTSLFDGRFFKISQETGQELLAWLETGAAEPDMNAILRGITGSASVDVLKSNWEAALQMLPERHHAAINKAKNARYRELMPKAEKPAATPASTEFEDMPQ